MSLDNCTASLWSCSCSFCDALWTETINGAQAPHKETEMRTTAQVDGEAFGLLAVYYAFRQAGDDAQAEATLRRLAELKAELEKKAAEARSDARD